MILNPCLNFKYICKTNRFVFHEKESIEFGEYKNFDIMFRVKMIVKSQNLKMNETQQQSIKIPNNDFQVNYN